jgi:ABC-type transport system involved in multi-copper enzyme maturation permease subunit
MRIVVARRNFRGLGHFEKSESMNAFVKKEIRLLLPSFLAVFLLAILVPWLSWKDPDTSFAWTPLVVFFGTILLAVDSFGREFSLGTFSSLMSQPMERRQIWRTKIGVLFSASALILIAYFISGGFLFHQALKIPVWSLNPKILGNDFWNAMSGSIATVFVALVGGLWTTLLLRQTAAAFWITLIVPMGILMLVALVMSKFFDSASDIVIFSVLYSAAGIYTISGSCLAHRLFHRAQDVAWTGGIISFSSWRYFEGGSRKSISVRLQKPFSALLKKEFQLQSINLFCAGALLALHIGVFILRASYSNFHKNELTDVIAEFFWTFWLVMPLVIGCMAVAEERKLGVMESQFCLPVSRRFQFIIKFVLVMIFGVLLGGFMPVFLEMLAARLGAPNEYFNVAGAFSNYDAEAFFSLMMTLSAALALVGFFASTLAKNFLQALSIAIVGIVGGFLFVQFLDGNWFPVVYGNQPENPVLWGMKFWGAILPVFIGVLMVIIFIPWLAARNFNHYVESGRLWRRNIFEIVGAILFVFASSATIYNRVWEIFEPAEPPHGAAKSSMAAAPKLHSDLQDNIQVRFPDGRVWFDSLRDFYPENQDSRWKYVWWTIYRPLPQSDGPQQFMGDSNWISAAGARRIDFWDPERKAKRVCGYSDTVGIQADGSLWISSKAKPVDWTGAEMVRFGDEANWQQVVSFYRRSFLLLKTDGTLWQWGNPNFSWNGWQTNWPSVRDYKPQQIGTNSDWHEIATTWFGLAKKINGNVWIIANTGKTNDVRLDRTTNYDQVAFQNASFGSGGGSVYERAAYIGKNGALWIRNIYLNNSDEKANASLTGFLQVGAETNWLAVAINWDRMVALKADGSLWRWPFDQKTTADVVKILPTSLGIHHDWVGVTSVWQGIISLAADGSLWLWPSSESQGVLLKLPKQPQLLGNIFGDTR